ncbi:FAD-linked oxidase C-terminal domain-containing protein [Cupriavidus sp. DF5525]
MENATALLLSQPPIWRGPQSEVEIGMMRAVRLALDPQGLMNSGKVV